MLITIYQSKKQDKKKRVKLTNNQINKLIKGVSLKELIIQSMMGTTKTLI